MAASSSSNNNNISDHSLSHRCFREWMQIQEESQRELLEALNAIENGGAATNPNEETERHLANLVDKSVEQFQEYIERRRELAKNDVSGYFAPVWCTARESSLMWMAGCRPSMFIRLVYSVTGLDLEARLAEFLQGRRSVEELRDLLPEQMEELNRVQMKTVREEEKLTSELAKVQEEIADQTVVGIAMDNRAKEEELEKALEKQDEEMMRIMEEADKLRMRTLNEVTHILKPLQAVMFLASSKKLHLCVRDWGKRTDQKHGRHVL